MQEIERDIETKGMLGTVEEIIGRQKYHMQLSEWYKRFISCFDNEEDEMTKKIISNGTRKLSNELDLSRILKKIRNSEIMSSYLLTEKQRYLLKFNTKHVVDSDSDLISLDSAESMFSVDSVDEDRPKSIRQKVMVKLLEEFDFRNDNCAYRLIDRDLNRGVGNQKNDSTGEKGDDEDSSIVDSDDIEGVRLEADPNELRPRLIGEDSSQSNADRSLSESNPPSAQRGGPAKGKKK